MSYLVLARKWRPMRFSDVVGQAHVVKTLVNAIKADRVAHSFVFSGVRGVGKTSLARILAKSLNCASGPTENPCGECNSCRTIASGNAVDVIEIDGASNNSVEDIRQLRETVPYVPSVGRYKIYVIDEVHMLSTSAFNALLKTLEEPPMHVKFIFATTEAHKIPLTILSRCQRYDFRRIPTSAIVDRVKKILNEEKIEADDAALALIGREAEGSMRDALSILDQVLASCEGRITAEAVAGLLGIVDGKVNYDISRAILNKNPVGVLEIIREVDNQGYDMPVFAKGLLEHFRNLVVTGVCKDKPSVLDLPDKEAEELLEQASTVSVDTLHRLLKHFAEAYESIARSSHPKIILEAALARIADFGELVPASTLISRLEAIASRTDPVSDRGSGGAGSGGGGNQIRGNSAPTSSTREAAEKRETAPKIETRNIDWNFEIDTLKKENPTIASILECCDLEPKQNNAGLNLRFPAEYKAVAGLASDRCGDLARYLSKKLGLSVRIDVAVDDTAELPAVTARKIEMDQKRLAWEEEAKNHPLVRKAESDLGAVFQGIRFVAESTSPNRHEP